MHKAAENEEEKWGKKCLGFIFCDAFGCPKALSQVSVMINQTKTRALEPDSHPFINGWLSIG